MSVDPAAVERFVLEYADLVAPKEAAVGEAWWKLATTGTEEAQRELVEAGTGYNAVFENAEDFERLRGFYRGRSRLGGPLARQVEVLYTTFAASRGDKRTLEDLEKLEAKANSVYSNHRATVGGEVVGENAVREILRSQADDSLRRGAWEGSKTVGREVEETVRELARLRNRLAREQGYENHYERSLDLQEIDPDELEEVMSGLESATDGPFEDFKRDLDRHLKEKFGVGRVMPWHFSDPFFQSAKQEVTEMSGSEGFQRHFEEKDLRALTRRTYDNLGLEVRDVFARSDLYERPGKDQHAFCLKVGRDYPYDVRVLANVRPDHYWMDTLLHEFGHAVYDKNVDPHLPFFLRSVAHTNTTEAVALMMGSLADDPLWLSQVAAVPAGERPDRINRLDKLVFVRWALVMYRFEKALYEDPDREDLNTLWWDLVERFQSIERPPGRDEPDWAAKIHVAISPVYYHNYVIGEVVATQLRAYIEENVTRGPFFQSEMAGRYLIEAVFGPGARENWRDTVERATGEPPNPRYFVESLVS